MELFCCAGLQRMMLSGCHKKFVWIAKKIIVVWIAEKTMHIVPVCKKCLIDVDCTKKAPVGCNLVFNF
jgi:hypothetical protein